MRLSAPKRVEAIMDKLIIEDEYPYREGFLGLLFMLLGCGAIPIGGLAVALDWIPNPHPQGRPIPIAAWLCISVPTLGFLASCWWLWIRLTRPYQRIAFCMEGILMPRNRFAREEEFVAYQDIADLWLSPNFICFRCPKGRFSIACVRTQRNDFDKIQNTLLTKLREIHKQQQADARLAGAVSIDAVSPSMADAVAPKEVLRIYKAGVKEHIIAYCFVLVGISAFGFGIVLFWRRDDVFLSIWATSIGVIVLIRAWLGIRYLSLRVALCKDGLVYVRRKVTEAMVWSDIVLFWDSSYLYPGRILGEAIVSFVIEEASGKRFRITGLKDIQELREEILKQVMRLLLPPALDAYKTGKTVSFGPFALDQRRVKYRSWSLSWEDVDVITFTVRPLFGDKRPKLVIRKTKEARRRAPWEILAKRRRGLNYWSERGDWVEVPVRAIPNLVVLVELLTRILGTTKVSPLPF
jgi:hypothetical protein